jgi:RNA polymerase sigma-70 factor (ECF subfamily)
LTRRSDDLIRREMVALLPRLRRFARALTGSLDEGDDLVQATYERAIRNLDQWQPGTRLDSWMFRIAQNIRLNRIRGMQTRNRHLRQISTDGHAVSDGVRAMESRSTLAAVRGFVARLPEEQRAVLLLVCVEGLSYKEVGETLDLPMGTVTSRLARARIALRAFIQGEAAPPMPTRVEA